MTIVCPGPVAPNAGEGTTRSLYGPKGPIQRQEVPDSKRMPAPRAVELIANAMAAGVAECWLARQPVLTMGECRVWRCSVGINSKVVVTRRQRAIRSGTSCMYGMVLIALRVSDAVTGKDLQQITAAALAIAAKLVHIYL